MSPSIRASITARKAVPRAEVLGRGEPFRMHGARCVRPTFTPRRSIMGTENTTLRCRGSCTERPLTSLLTSGFRLGSLRTELASTWIFLAEEAGRRLVGAHVTRAGILWGECQPTETSGFSWPFPCPILVAQETGMESSMVSVEVKRTGISQPLAPTPMRRPTPAGCRLADLVRSD